MSNSIDALKLILIATFRELHKEFNIGSYLSTNMLSLDITQML